jgi:hypothetical protein
MRDIFHGPTSLEWLREGGKRGVGRKERGQKESDYRRSYSGSDGNSLRWRAVIAGDE